VDNIDVEISDSVEEADGRLVFEEGATDGREDGARAIVGINVGSSVGERKLEGSAEGLNVTDQTMDCSSEKTIDGFAVGRADGFAVGHANGFAVGKVDGFVVRPFVGYR